MRPPPSDGPSKRMAFPTRGASSFEQEDMSRKGYKAIMTHRCKAESGIIAVSLTGYGET